MVMVMVVMVAMCQRGMSSSGLEVCSDSAPASAMLVESNVRASKQGHPSEQYGR